jgi:hypothetical protein
VTDLTKERIRVFSIGLLAAVAAAFVRAILFRFVGTTIPFLTFFLAIILASLWGGTRAGVTASLVSLLLAPVWMSPEFDALDRLAWLNLSLFAVT